jgi:bifunctional DNase/RNase
MDVGRNSIGLVKHNEIQQLATKKDHHPGRPLVVTLLIEVRRTAPLNVRHLRIQDLSHKEFGTKL